MADVKDIPQFELYGPPCTAPDCKGVLTPTWDLKTKEGFQKCSKCKGRFDRHPTPGLCAMLEAEVEAQKLR